MKPELIDQLRRELRADLGARLQQAGIDLDLGERVASDLGELLDALLIAYQSAELDRHTAPIVGSFVFSVAWQRIITHMAPLSARAHGAPGRVVERLSMPLAREAVDA